MKLFTSLPARKDGTLIVRIKGATYIFEGKPLACRNASREEMKTYANQLKQRRRGTIEIALTRQVGVLEQDQCELLDFLLTESSRPVTFIALFDRDDIPEAVRDTLRRAAPMIAKGARPQTSPLPLTRECNMDNPFAFAAFPAWKRVFADTSKEAQKKVYADPAFRNQFRADLKNPTGFSDWRRVVVHDVRNPALKHLERKSIAQIGELQGKDGVDAFLDTVLADGDNASDPISEEARSLLDGHTPSVASMFRLQWEEVQQAWVLLYPEGMVKLNGSAGEIIKRLDGQKNVVALIAELEKDFETTGLQNDVLAFLDIAKQQGWVKP